MTTSCLTLKFCLNLANSSCCYQEENQYVAVPRAKLLEYPEHIQRKIGYEMSAPYVGWVEVGDPLPYVTGKKQILGDLF